LRPVRQKEFLFFHVALSQAQIRSLRTWSSMRSNKTTGRGWSGNRVECYETSVESNDRV
jgi:hypothetical protein